MFQYQTYSFFWALYMHTRTYIQTFRHSYIHASHQIIQIIIIYFNIHYIALDYIDYIHYMTLHYLTLHYMTITLHCIPSNKQTHMYIHTYIHSENEWATNPAQPTTQPSPSDKASFTLQLFQFVVFGIGQSGRGKAWDSYGNPMCMENAGVFRAQFFLYMLYRYILQCYYFSRFLAFSARQLQFVHTECGSNTDQSSDCTPSKRGSMRKV